jgi:hypothetical protein
VNSSLKRRYLPTSPHGVTTQKNNIDIFTAVITSNLTQIMMLFLTYFLKYYCSFEFLRAKYSPQNFFLKEDGCPDDGGSKDL